MAPKTSVTSPTVRSLMSEDTFVAEDTVSPLEGLQAFRTNGSVYTCVVASEHWLPREGWMVRYGIPWCHALSMRLLHPDGCLCLYLGANEAEWDEDDDRRFMEVGMIRYNHTTIRSIGGYLVQLRRRFDCSFTTISVRGDGNCQFRAISLALLGDEEKHSSVRAAVVEDMRKHPLPLESRRAMGAANVVTQAWTLYCDAMARNGEWGDQISLCVASRLFNVAFVLYNTDTHSQYLLTTEGLGVMDRTTRVVYLEYTQDTHYNLRQRVVMMTPPSRKRPRPNDS
jgi:hypothetical protein